MPKKKATYNKITYRKNPVTWQDVEVFFGEDATINDYQSFIADIANQVYDAEKYLYDSIRESVDEQS
jgi:hypothetical protein